MSDLILLVRELLVSGGRVLPGDEGAELRGLPVTVERVVGGRGAPVDFPAPLRLSAKTIKFITNGTDLYVYIQRDTRSL